MLAHSADVSDSLDGIQAGGFRLEDATASFFRRYLNMPFHARSADGARVRMVLREVAERPVTRNIEQFSLIFHAPPGRTVPDGTQTLHHSTLGAFDLFIVPIGAGNARRTVYQACFSRLQRAGGSGSQADRLEARSSWRT